MSLEPCLTSSLDINGHCRVEYQGVLLQNIQVAGTFSAVYSFLPMLVVHLTDALKGSVIAMWGFYWDESRNRGPVWQSGW